MIYTRIQKKNHFDQSLAAGFRKSVQNGLGFLLSVSPVLLFFLSLSDSASFISVSDLLCSLPARFTLAFNIFVFVNLLLCV
ncbi:unnamed protein product [Brassica oleracea]